MDRGRCPHAPAGVTVLPRTPPSLTSDKGEKWELKTKAGHAAARPANEVFTLATRLAPGRRSRTTTRVVWQALTAKTNLPRNYGHCK